MTVLTNLLSYIPGASGFSSYIRRVLPGIPGPRLLIDPETNNCRCQLENDLPQAAPTGRRLRLLQRLSLAQHGVDPRRAVDEALRTGLLHDLPDVVYSPFCDALLGWKGAPQVITCHDLTPLYISNSRKATWRYRLWTPRHLKCATRIIAISQFVADQLVSHGVCANQIDIVLNGIAVERSAVGTATSEDIVILARHDRNKNVAGAIEALNHLQTTGSAWRGRMIVVGRHGRQTDDLRRRQQLLPRPDALVMVSHLSHDDLIELIRGAWLLASFSRMEGFDYPIMEAKAEGIPTLVSAIPVHRELHHGSSLFFQLDDGGQSFAEAVERLRVEQSLWGELGAAGRSLAVKLSLERQQAQIREAIDACRQS